MATSSDWLSWAIRQTQVDPEETAQVGELTLSAHQVSGANRLFAMVSRYGGALLADATGLGKTRVALAAAARIRRASQTTGPIIVCAPARTLGNWQTAAARAQVGPIEVVSHHQLSRGRVFQGSVVIADEAHRFRNPKTKRSQALCAITANTPTLFLTATPVANSVWDLYQLLKLFLAEDDLRDQIGCDLRWAFEQAEAGKMDLTQVLQLVCVRRVETVDANFRRPSAHVQLLPYLPSEDEAWVWKHLDQTLNGIGFELLRGDWPLGLLREHILRRWEAGPQALLQTIDYLAEYHTRWLDVQATGGHLVRADFLSLFGSDFRQGVLGFMFDQDSPDFKPAVDAVRRDATALEALRTRLQGLDAGGGIQTAIVDLLQRDPGKLLVFTSFVTAAEALFAGISRALGHLSVGLLTGTDARATGLGRIPGEQVLQRFSPKAHGLRMPESQQLAVVVATDCISEGVNLQDCTRVVLGDLPHSPLTIEQRVGRLLRPGAGVDRVDVFVPRPTDWNDTLGLQRRLEHKMDHASHAGTDYTTRLSAPSRPAELNPLRVLTDLDQLATRSPGTPTELVVEVTGVDVEIASVLLIETHVGPDFIRRLEVIDQGGEVVPLVKALPSLIRIFDSGQSFWPSAPSPEINQRISQINAALQSAAYSPRELTLDSPQARAWRLIQGQEGAQQLHDTLLQPMARGECWELERHIKNGAAAVVAWAHNRQSHIQGPGRARLAAAMMVYSEPSLRGRTL